MQDLFHLIWVELRGAWRYRWPAMLTAWAICLAGWLFVFAMPNIYEARAQVYVDADSRLAEVMGEVGVAQGVGSRVFVVRQAMLGRPQLERVARETDLDLRAETPEAFDSLVTSLRNNVGVDSGRSSQAQNLYTITFRDRDRGMAISVVQTLLDTFVEDVLKLEVQDTQDVTGYLEDQLNYYSELLTNAESALADFKKEFVGLLPGESGDIFDRLQTEMATLEGFRSQLQIQEGRRSELRRQLQSQPANLPDGGDEMGVSAIPRNPTEESIVELESRRSQLLLGFTERHPDVIALDEQLEQLYAKRDSDLAALGGISTGIEGAANANNPVYQSVQIALNETAVQIAELRSQVTQSERTVNRLSGQINTIPEVEAQFAVLTRDYDQYNSLYDELLIRKERERLGAVGENRDVVSFNITDPPSAESDPVAPRRMLLLLVVLVMGVGAGGAVAFLIHQLNPVFHDPKTLRQFSNRPVLGVVSMTWLERHKSARRLDFSSFAISGMALIGAFLLSVALKDQIVSVVGSVIS